MNKIKIFDTTLRDGEQAPGFSMHSSEKLEIAVQLEQLGVDVIEAGFAISSKGDYNSIVEIAKHIKNSTICSLSRATELDIEESYKSLKLAVSPRIHLFLATSPIHMQYKLKMSEAEVLDRIFRMCKFAKSKMSDVQFSCEDATRSDREFLLQAVNQAVLGGATTINIPDTVGYAFPNEMQDLLCFLRERIDKDITLAVHCHNDLGMGVANSLSAVIGGATQVECTINGIGERAGNASLEEIVMALRTREQTIKAVTNINTKQIFKTSKLISGITGIKIPPNKAIVGANAFMHESGIHQHGVMANRATYEIISRDDIGLSDNNLVLGKHSGKHAFCDYLNNMGYKVGKEEQDLLFIKFKDFADKKKTITQKDIEYLLTHSNVKAIKKFFSLDIFGITSQKGGAVGFIVLDSEKGKMTATSYGDGPLDAAFKAINIILTKEFKLEDYSVNAVTEGEDALGAATLRLSLAGITMTGRGVSTDIVEASILAYINACNKLLDDTIV